MLWDDTHHEESLSRRRLDYRESLNLKKNQHSQSGFLRNYLLFSSEILTHLYTGRQLLTYRRLVISLYLYMYKNVLKAVALLIILWPTYERVTVV